MFTKQFKKSTYATDHSSEMEMVFNPSESSDKEVTVKFIPKWNDIQKKWDVGKYNISVNYDSQSEQLLFNIDSKRWEQQYDSTNANDVEQMLKNLLVETKYLQNIN
jgi:hypothetical protein